MIVVIMRRRCGLSLPIRLYTDEAVARRSSNDRQDCVGIYVAGYTKVTSWTPLL